MSSEGVDTNVEQRSNEQRVAIVTLPGFNEIDTFVATRMIDSVPGLHVELVGPDETAVSMAGVEVATPGDLHQLADYDAVIVGSGIQTFEHIENESMMDEIVLAPTGDQLVGSQCSGAAILHRLGLVDGITVCTDLTTTPKLQALGVAVANEAFRADDHLATSGGCLSSAYLAFWMISRLMTVDAAVVALAYVSPVGEADDYVDRAMRLTQPQRDVATSGS